MQKSHSFTFSKGSSSGRKKWVIDGPVIPRDALLHVQADDSQNEELAPDKKKG